MNSVMIHFNQYKKFYLIGYYCTAKHIWKQYPTLEMMMEMVMTNIYTFPPITSGDELERINAQERQVGILCLQ